MLILLVILSLSLFMSDPDSHLETLLTGSDAIADVSGYVSGQYRCQYQGVDGTLYAGSSALYFLGSYFLFEKKAILEWSMVRKVEKIDHGIEVLTKNDVRHQFTSLHANDRVWVVLVSLHNDSLMERPGRRSSSATPRGLRRMNSDPLMTSQIRFLDESLVDDEKKSGDSQELAPAPESTRSQSATESFILSTAGIDIQSVENVAGKLTLQPIRCTCHGVKGKLYAGKGAIYFYGRKFFWDSSEILLKWETIRQIQMVDAPSGKDSACVGLHLVTKDDQVYRFLKMDNADRVWASLVALHNDSLTSRAEQRRPRSRSFRRMNSDPTLASPLDVAESMDAADSLALTVSADAMDKLPVEQLVIEKLEGPVDDKADWAQIRHKSDYSYLVVNEHVLNCNLDKFFDLFFKDNAKFSIAKFLESRGDSNLQSSEWIKEGVNRTRVLHYIHPVNAPLAPPTAAARKEQSYRRFSDSGLCVWTKTFVDDVPMADCFYVSDRIRVEPQGKKVAVWMEFEITFVKSTMFKSIITKTTSSEVTAVFAALAEYMSDALGGAKQHKPAPAAIAPPPPTTSWFSNPNLPLMLIIIAFQVYIIVELRGIRKALGQVQSAATDNGSCPADN